MIDIDFNSSILNQLLNLLQPTVTRKYLRIKLILTQTDKLKFDWNSLSHSSGAIARKSCEIKRGNLSSQSLNLVRDTFSQLDHPAASMMVLMDVLTDL